MKVAGRVHWITLLGLVGAVAIIALFLFSKESPEAAANRFLVALAKGDVKTLTDLSYYPDGDKQKLVDQWNFAVNTAGKHYLFRWKTKFGKETDSRFAIVAVGFHRDLTSPTSYEENYQIPMVQDGGRWKVDVRSLSRTMYPALPR